MCLVHHACRLSWVGAPTEALSSIPHMVVVIVVCTTFILWKPHLCHCWVGLIIHPPCYHCHCCHPWAVCPVKALSSLLFDGSLVIHHLCHYCHHCLQPFMLWRPCHCCCPVGATLSIPHVIIIIVVVVVCRPFVLQRPCLHYCLMWALLSIPHHCHCHCWKMAVVIASLQGKRARPYLYHH